jgi:hypothetical protein
MTLAEVAPSGNQWNGFWAVVAFLSGIAMNLVTVWAFTRKQKREVTFGFTPASKEEFDKQAAANEMVHRDLFSKIGGVERGAKKEMEEKANGLREERREDMRTIHHEINEVGKKVAGLEKETQTQNQWLGRIDEKLDRIKTRA